LSNGERGNSAMKKYLRFAAARLARLLRHDGGPGPANDRTYALEALQRRLATLVPDARVRESLLTYARMKYPAQDDVWIYELVIEQLLRDRR
jgi:hypothetical protein